MARVFLAKLRAAAGLQLLFGGGVGNKSPGTERSRPAPLLRNPPLCAALVARHKIDRRPHGRQMFLLRQSPKEIYVRK